MSDWLDSETTFFIDDPDAFVAFWIAEFEEHGYEYTHPSPWRLELTTPYGTAVIVLDGSQVTIALKCPTLDVLFDVRTAIVQHLTEFAPHLADIAWSGANAPGEMPPNFKLAKVISCKRVGRSYLRMTVQGHDMARFGHTGLHFRVVRQENPDRPPVWPTINAKGIAQWPDGEDALRHKVYTTRYFDAATGTLTFDIFNHDGGDTCEWASTAPVGQVVGLMGPGGGWFPDAQNLLLAGDETALPAIARILENLPRDARGVAILLVEDMDDVQRIYAPAGYDVRWLSRSAGDDLVAATKAASAVPFEMRWFAAHQGEARAMRTFWRDDQKLDRGAFTSVAYWH